MPDNNWSEAFSALPTETPEPLGWERLQARLPASTPKATHRNWPRWLAAAAVLAGVAAIPLALSRIGEPPAAKPITARTTAPALDIARTTVAAPANDNVSSSASRKSAAPRNRHVATAMKANRISPAEPARADDGLEPLYRQSAQLEALLAMTHDDQVAGGVSTALSDDLGAQISRIDDRLSQSGLQPRQRAALWHQRIDALQQLVGIAATDRLYSARGQRNDAVLVSID